MPKMKAVQVSAPGADFELIEREIPYPPAGHVRIRVQACGVCHSDSLTKEGGWPGIQYPRIPGHEVAGVIDELGSGIAGWKKGQRIGVGWQAGMTAPVFPAAAAIFRIVKISSSPASAMTAVMPNTWSPR